MTSYGQYVNFVTNIMDHNYVVEDEFHFVYYILYNYNHIRSHYIQKYFNHPSPATLISLISSKSHNVIRDLAGFIYHACKLHSLNNVWYFVQR